MVVVQIHQTARVALDFARVQKSTGKLHAETNVHRAAAPLPLLLLVRLAGQRRVAAALRDVALGACLRDCVHGAGAGYRVRERRLA